MKKTLKLFSVLFVMALVMTGCGQKNANDTLNSAIDKMEKIDSAKFTMSVNGRAAMQGTEITASLKAEGEASKKNAHATVTLEALGMKQTAESYAVEKDGKLLTYTNAGDGWKVSESEMPKEEKMDTSKLKNWTKVTRVKTDKKGYDKLEVVYDSKKLNELADNEEVKAVAGDQLDQLKGVGDLKINVYIKDGYIQIMEINLDDLVKDIAKENNIEATGVITIVLSDINKVKEVKVPEDVVKNAKAE